MASSTQVMPGMMGVYNQLLAKNTENYNNALGAYGSGQNTIAQALPGISGAYGQINKEVGNILGQGGDWGVATPAANAIRNTLQQNQAQNDQGMINRGLGNSTIRSNVSGQLAQDASMAYGNLGASLADKYAGYRSQIGLAQQAAQMQGLGLQTQLWGQMGGALLNYHFANTAGNLMGGFSSDPLGGGRGGLGGGGGFGSASDSSPWLGDRPTGIGGALNNSFGSDVRLQGGYQGTPFGGLNPGQVVSPYLNAQGGQDSGFSGVDDYGDPYTSSTYDY